MFKRIILEDWHNILPFLGFFFFVGIFLYLSTRAIYMNKKTSSRIAHLVFDEEDKKEMETTRHE